MSDKAAISLVYTCMRPDGRTGFMVRQNGRILFLPTRVFQRYANRLLEINGSVEYVIDKIKGD